MDVSSSSNSKSNNSTGSDYDEVDEIDEMNIKEALSLGEELNQLSMKERERVLHDIHGVADDFSVEETPKLIEETLHEMDQYLLQTMARTTNEPTNKKNKQAEAYRLAEAQNAADVKDRKLRLIFLRAQDFDPKQAVNHMLKFFHQKLDLFGPAKVGKDITLDDMTSEDLECIENGHLQQLPARDQAGRALITMSVSHLRCRHTESLVRLHIICSVNFANVSGLVSAHRPSFGCLPSYFRPLPSGSQLLLRVHGCLARRRNPKERNCSAHVPDRETRSQPRPPIDSESV